MISTVKDIQIIAAGGITHDNLSDIHRQLQASAYHGRRIVSDTEPVKQAGQ